MSPKENEKEGETGHNNKFQFKVDNSKILSLLYHGDADSQSGAIQCHRVGGLPVSSLYLENLSNFNINFYPFTAALSET